MTESAFNDARSEITFHLISDAETSLAESILKTAATQFPNVKISWTSHSFIQNEKHLRPILQRAEKEKAHIVTTFVLDDLDRMTHNFCEENGLWYYNPLQPIIQIVTRQSNEEATNKPGIRRPLNEDYYRKIEALEFAVNNDDGKNSSAFHEADIVLLGISRTSKTPLSIYLAFKGYKVANLPLVPESPLPEEIFKIETDKIIGLTNDMNVLQKYRKRRLESYGIEDDGIYNSADRIEQELNYANDVYNKLKCPIINVADRSIEETASLILLFHKSAHAEDQEKVD